MDDNSPSRIYHASENRHLPVFNYGPGALADNDPAFVADDGKAEKEKEHHPDPADDRIIRIALLRVLFDISTCLPSDFRVSYSVSERFSTATVKLGFCSLPDRDDPTALCLQYPANASAGGFDVSVMPDYRHLFQTISHFRMVLLCSPDQWGDLLDSE